MASATIENVSDTALLVAAYRATESERSDALFHDPFARKLAGERGLQLARHMKGRARFGEWLLAIRTPIIDAFIEQAIANGIDTVMNLGAGLDARAYRMNLPSDLRWIEVDYAHMIEAKERVLASDTPRCKIERVKLDLADVTSRRKLFDEIDAGSNKVLVLTEGVVPYLRNDDVAALADDLHKMKSARAWIVEYLSPAWRLSRKRMRGFKKAPFQFDPNDWYAFFAERGWSVKEKKFLAEESHRLERHVPLPRLVRLIFQLRKLFLPKGAPNNWARFAGYLMMEKTDAS
jgi:methyltransferase (TIGR00027 family)